MASQRPPVDLEGLMFSKPTSMNRLSSLEDAMFLKSEEPKASSKGLSVGSLMTAGPISFGKQITDVPQVKQALQTPGAVNRSAIMNMGFGDKSVPNPIEAERNPQSVPSLRSRFMPQALERAISNPMVRTFGGPAVEVVNMAAGIPDMVVDPVQMTVAAVLGRVLESPFVKQEIPYRMARTRFGSIQELRSPRPPKVTPKQLSEELLFNIEKARKDVGSAQGALIDTQGGSRVDPNRLNQIIKSLPPQLQEEIMTNPELQREVINQIEQSQFVMGGASKQVSPQITSMRKTRIEREVPSLSGKKRFESVRTQKGRFGRSAPKGEVFTPNKFVESPENIVSLNIPAQGAKTQKIVSVTPKTTYNIRPEVKGLSNVSEGETVISPTLKNLERIRAITKGKERIRAITKGKVRTSTWNPRIVQDLVRNQAEEGYKNIGSLMKEGRPDVASAMEDYAKVRAAEKEITSLLKTRFGMTKTKPMLRAFGEGADNAKKQAIDVLSKYNPEIPKVIQKINAMAEGIAKEKAKSLFINEIKKYAARTIGVGSIGLAGWKIFD
jgi:hypothetical protein